MYSVLRLTKTRSRVTGRENGSRVQKTGHEAKKRVSEKDGLRIGKDWVSGSKIYVKKKRSVHSKSLLSFKGIKLLNARGIFKKRQDLFGQIKV